MVDEAQIRSSLQITVGNDTQYRSAPTAFNANVPVFKGPTPGLISVTTAGVDVDLSLLTTPGLAFIQNLDGSNFMEGGIWDGSSFYPLYDWLAGEGYTVRFSACLGQEFGVGTGTTGAGINKFRLKADTATLLASVEAFEK